MDDMNITLGFFGIILTAMIAGLWYLSTEEGNIDTALNDAEAGISDTVLSNPISQASTNATVNWNAAGTSGNLSYVIAPDYTVQAYGGGVGGTAVTSSTASAIENNINSNNPGLTKTAVYIATNNAGQTVSVGTTAAPVASEFTNTFDFPSSGSSYQGPGSYERADGIFVLVSSQAEWNSYFT